jgi:tetratricopeptide (TPR) repeat protein
MRTLRCLVLLLALLPATAFADPPLTRARSILLAAPDPAALRGALIAYADSVVDRDREGAAEALGYAGLSFQREGRVDSAIVCHRRALQLSGSPERVIALVDQLLLRRATGDAAEAITRLEAAIAVSEAGSPPELVGRLAWATYLKGDAARASAIIAPVAPRLASRPEWSYRLGKLAMETGDPHRAVALLLPAAARSRGTDDDVIGMLSQAGREGNIEERLKREVQRLVAERDRSEMALAADCKGRLLELVAGDGFPLGALLVPAPARPGARRPLVAVVLMAPGDTLASADSLIGALRGHGLTTLFLHLRGYGASVGPSCPSPDAWFDREVQLEARVARDVADVFRAVRRLGPVDTTRYIVAGVGASAGIAIDAARLDPRVAALLLVSPDPPDVEIGRARAQLAALRLPVFFQLSGDDLGRIAGVTDLLYQAGDRSASRVVEANIGGRHLEQFRNDPQLAARFLTWVDATLRPTPAPRPRRPAPRPTPPTRRR